METNEFLEKPVKGLFYRYLVPSIIGTNESFNNESSKSESGCPIQAKVT